MIETPRLLLRRWRAEDLGAFHTMGRHPDVSRFLGPPPSPRQCKAIATRQNGYADTTGRCLWAVERRDDGRFIGLCGVQPGPQGTPIADTPEIAWRFDRSAWGLGYAREAALAVLAAEWARGTPEVFAVTVPANARSWSLMERLGMTRDMDRDFDHPGLPPGDPYRRHILYSIARPR